MNDFMNVVEEIMAEVKAMNENGHVEDFADELVDEDTAISGAVADELEAGAIGDRVEEIKEELAPTGIGISGDQIKDLIKLGAIAGVEVYVRDKDGKNVRKVDYTLTNTDFEKDPDDIDYIDENLKEHFKRFMFKKYK
jgi:glycyl-tRNA synthetase (class II)